MPQDIETKLDEIIVDKQEELKSDSHSNVEISRKISNLEKVIEDLLNRNIEIKQVYSDYAEAYSEICEQHKKYEEYLIKKRAMLEGTVSEEVRGAIDIATETGKDAIETTIAEIEKSRKAVRSSFVKIYNKEEKVASYEDDYQELTAKLSDAQEAFSQLGALQDAIEEADANAKYKKMYLLLKEAEAVFQEVVQENELVTEATKYLSELESSSQTVSKQNSELLDLISERDQTKSKIEEDEAKLAELKGERFSWPSTVEPDEEAGC